MVEINNTNNNFIDILEKKRSSSDFLWATKDLNLKIAYDKSKTFTPAGIKSIALNGYRLKKILKMISQEKNIPFEVLHKLAKKILEETGYNKKIPTMRWLAFFVTKIFKKLLLSIYINEEKFLQIKHHMGCNPLLFVPSHKSYCDFILMTYICFDYDVDVPRVAAGMDFQSMTIMGNMLRDVCAFFMRRSFSNDELYSAVFSQYVMSLITHGDAGVEFFIEGTRSRTQKSLMPKFGFLSMALKPFVTGLVPDITIVPVNLSYDRVLEEVLFAYELLGVPKPKESTKGVLKVWNILDENYGNVYVNFGEPFSVADYLRNKIDRSVHGFGPVEMQDLTPEESKHITLLAHHIVRKQKELTVLTCFNLIATVLNNVLSRSCEPLFLDKLVLEVQWLFSVLKVLAPEDSLWNVSGITEDVVVHHIKLHKALVCLSAGGQKIQLCRIHLAASYSDKQLKGYKLSNSTMDIATIFLMLQYYSNPCATFLISVCLIALIVQSLPKDGVLSVDKLLDDFKFLCSIFSYEFVFHNDFIDKDFEDAFNHSQNLKVIRLTDENQIQKGDNEKLRSFCTNFLRPYLPGVISVMEVLLGSVEMSVSEKKILETCQGRIECQLNSGNVIHPANLSLDLLTNTLHSLASMNAVFKSKGKDGLEYKCNKEELEKIHYKLKNFYLNYGWEHFWCDPCKNTSLKDYVKGPFSNPKLTFPFPYISLSQTEGELLKIRTGIPDCWGEYLVRQLVGDYDSMHKEDVDIAHKLRKDYRIYLGQGIPNPCIAPYYPGFSNCKGLKESLRKYLLQTSNKNRKGNCLCCEKNYLLECPDKSNKKNQGCTCKTCHSRGVEYGDECRCIEILQNWASEDIHLKERRRRGGKKNEAKYSSSGSSGCETDDEGTIVSFGKKCICPKNIKMGFNRISSGNSNVSCMERESKREEYIFGKDILYKGFTEKKGGFGFFPYTRNVHRGNKRLRFKDVKAASKEIQTENRVMGDTKTVQTENAESKVQTSNKCFRCTLYQHQYSTCKLKPFEKTLCIPPGIINNHAIICPYTCHDHLPGRKPYWVGSVEKKQKTKETTKKANSGDYQKNAEMEDDILNKYKIGDVNSSKLNYQNCLKSFDSLKYLTDSRLKNYLRERETLRRFQNKTSQTSRIIREEPSPREKLDKFKFLHRKPKTSDSFHVESPRKSDRCVKYVDRGVMTAAEDGIRKKELVTKYFKNAVESDESRTYGLVRSRESNRKRRKLVCSRKRRKICGKKKIENGASKLKHGRNEKSPRDDNDVIKFRECSFKFKQIADESKKPELGSFVELFKHPRQCEKMSPEKLHRSPDVMKFIVGDLIIDEKSKT